MRHSLLSMLCAVVLSGGLAAQAAAPAPAQDPDAKVAKRLLHAQAGGVLREDSRWRDDHWEVKRDGEWTALPAGLVVAARREAEVLDEWRERKADVGRDDVDARAALAEWGVAEGLYKEALAQLDLVLEAEPDHPAALALLGRDDLPIGVPQTASLLDVAAASPPALRELAVHELVALPREPADDELLHADLGARLLDRQSGTRAAAALTLRRLAAGSEPPVEGYSEPELAELLRRAVRDVSPEVRHQAALALRDANEEGLLLPLFKALGSTSPAIRTHATQAMAVMGHPRAVEPLVVRLLTLQPSGGDAFSAPRSSLFVGRQIAFVQDFDVEVAQSAAIGNPQVGVLQEGVSLDVAVLGSSGGGGYGYVQEGEALCKALEQLTGAKPGRTKAAWQQWWSENRSAFLASDAPTTSSPPTKH